MGTKPLEIVCQDITSVRFMPDGVNFVTGDRFGALRQWSAVDRAQDSAWTINTNRQIDALVVSTDGRWIVSGGTSNKVTIWSTATRERAIEIAEHTGEIHALDISNDSARLASASADKTVQIFDIKSGIRLIHPLEHPDRVVCVEFSPDASRIATAMSYSSSHTSTHIRVYNNYGNKVLECPSGPATMGWRPPLAWSSLGEWLFTASSHSITRFGISTSRYSSASSWSIPTNGNNQQVLIVTSGKFIACSAGSLVSFWDCASRARVGQTIDHATNIVSISISQDGRRLVCGHGRGITVHSLEGLIPEHLLPGVLCLPLMRISTTALKSWVQGNLGETEVILSNEILQPPNHPTHDALAIHALIRTHMGEWRTAETIAEKSLQIKPSPIGQIARSVSLVGAGQLEAALDELDLAFCHPDSIDNKLLLAIKYIILFVCNKHERATSCLRRFIDVCDGTTKEMYLQILGMMYLKQGHYEDAVETLSTVNNPFTIEDRGPLMSLFIIFNWNFENLKFIARQRLCGTLYTTKSVKVVGDVLLKILSPMTEDDKEAAHGQILQEIITRSGEVDLLAWTGKSSTCNSCLPNSPVVYTQASEVLPSVVLQGEALQKRTAELRTTFPLVDALLIYSSITRSQPVRFAHFRLLLPCIVFRVKFLRAEGNIYRAATAGLGDIEFTTEDSLPFNQPRKLVFVNPWIDHLRESRGLRDDWEDESDVESNAQTGRGGGARGDIDTALVHEPMIEEAPASPSRTPDADIHTRALELIARLERPFSALLLLRQPDGAYKRVAADNEIVVRGIEDDVLRGIRVEFLEVL